MPVTSSAKKALKTAIRRKEENDKIRSEIKSAIKGAKISISNKSDDVAEKIALLYRELDLASKKNVIHKNKASRLKSRITKAAAKAEMVSEGKPAVKKAQKAKTPKTKKAK